MKNRLVVVTDLGSFKAYRLEENELHSSPRLDLVENFDTAVEEKISDQVTDQPGRFPKGTSVNRTASGDMSAGERHNLDLERRRRAVKKVAEQINRLLRPNEVDGCYFAASNEINSQILNELEPGVRKKIEKNATANLTKIDKAELLNHF